MKAEAIRETTYYPSRADPGYQNILGKGKGKGKGKAKSKDTGRGKGKGADQGRSASKFKIFASVRNIFILFGDTIKKISRSN